MRADIHDDDRELHELQPEVGYIDGRPLTRLDEHHELD
jgi:hypothetical protein